MIAPEQPDQAEQAGQIDQWVWLARIRRPQGRKGEVFADLLTDFPEKFAERRWLWLLAEGRTTHVPANWGFSPARSNSRPTGCTRAAWCCTLPGWIPSLPPKRSQRADRRHSPRRASRFWVKTRSISAT
jgi:hypothetical protein